MSHNIYFQINHDTVLDVPVDVKTFKELVDSDDFAYKYFVSLVEKNVLDINEDITSVNISTDNINFFPLAGDVDEGSTDKRKLIHTPTDSMQRPESQTLNSEWTTNETKYLLNQYETYLSMVGPLKTFKTKKVMWAEISNDLKTFLNVEKTAVQCENRYKTIIKRKKKAVENNHSSGASRLEIPYQFELNKINALDDSIEPEITRDASNVSTKSDCSTSASSIPDTTILKKRKRNGVVETLLAIHKEKEEAKERRHKERLEVLKEIGNLLSQQNP